MGTTLLGGFIGGVPGDGLIEDIGGPEHGPGASEFWDDTALTRASLGLLPHLGVGIGALDVVDGFSEQVEGGVRGDPLRYGLGGLQTTLGLGSLIGTRYPTVGVVSSAGSFALTGAKELAGNFESNPLNWF